jgi:hypothetical protein
MAETLTLQQVSEKLLKVEKALGSLYNLNSPEAMDKIKTLKVIKESLINKKAILLQESNVMVTTKSGDTTVIPSSDKSSIDALKKDSNVASIEDTSGTKIKEAEESDVALNMDYVGKVLTGLFTDFLRDIGEEISSVDYNSISKDEIEVKIEFKEGTNKNYKFKIEGDKLFIDGNYLIDISRLPSGEVQIPQETLSSSLYKHFEGELEFNDMDVNEMSVRDRDGITLFIGDKIKVGNIIFEINFDSKENLVYLESRGKKYLGGSKEFRAILEGSTLHIDDSNFITEMVEVGDRVKISKSYGGSRGTVVDKKDSFITLEGGESYPESEVVNVSRKLGQDIDVGHVDDEPGMLSQTAYETAVHAANIYKQLKAYERLNTEVDFPNWWQSKVILAKDYISKADSWLEFTTRERNFMEEEKNTKES